MERYEVKSSELHPAFDPEQAGLITVYLASDVEVVLKRQAAAAIAGMNAATAISAGQVRQAHRLRAESSPEALESERQANAILTARIAELEKLLTECLNTNENEHMDPDLVTRVNRALMER
jgi:uncharacterized protein YcbK (DUF882 family)